MIIAITFSLSSSASSCRVYCSLRSFSFLSFSASAMRSSIWVSICWCGSNMNFCQCFWKVQYFGHNLHMNKMNFKKRTPSNTRNWVNTQNLSFQNLQWLLNWLKWIMRELLGRCWQPHGVYCTSFLAFSVFRTSRRRASNFWFWLSISSTLSRSCRDSCCFSDLWVWSDYA